ncbi:hypothetical protein [Thalassobius sp. I31.1]|uniref:hypothetical protein n=1 Tax=Thalassobius sp. I31.1 TaxID=2109912 RepID=UPI0013003252|nr:hypothetical protein [Thalassobius sp. I31.1]
MSQIVEKALTPEEWSLKLQARGVLISPRTIRSKAREYDQYYSLGRMMMLLPEHIDEMMRLESLAMQNKNKAQLHLIDGQKT